MKTEKKYCALDVVSVCNYVTIVVYIIKPSSSSYFIFYDKIFSLFLYFLQAGLALVIRKQALRQLNDGIRPYWSFRKNKYRC